MSRRMHMRSLIILLFWATSSRLSLQCIVDGFDCKCVQETSVSNYVIHCTEELNHVIKMINFSNVSSAHNYTIAVTKKIIPVVESLGKVLDVPSLDLSSNHIQILSSRLFNDTRNIVTLTLAYNLLTSLESLYNKNLGNLTILNMNNNFITSIEPKWTVYLAKLEKLMLVNNLIAYLTKDTFFYFKSLTSLGLSQNQIEVIYEGAFVGLFKLISLDLDGNNLKLVESFGFLGLSSLNANSKSLTGMDLSFLNIPSLQPYTFYGLNSLTSLNLAYNLLSTLSNNTFYGMTKLVSLGLNGNNLDTIETRAFDSLSSLEQLLLVDNLLTDLRRGIFENLYHLSSLNLHFNDIYKMDLGLFDHVNKTIEYIDLSLNKLNYIRAGHFSGLEKLEYLNLQFNQISSIESGSFSSLKNLNTLYLDNNCIYTLSDQFNNLSSLKELSLHQNVLYKINMSVFWGLNKLELLNLSRNLIDQIEPDLFKNQTSLIKLDLSRNQLSYLSANSFYNLNKLAILDLSHNQLQSLSSDCFIGLIKLSELYLGSNWLLPSLNGSLKAIRTCMIFDFSNTRFNDYIEFGKFFVRERLDVSLRNVSKQFLADFLNQSLENGVFKIKTLDLSYNELMKDNVLHKLLSTWKFEKLQGLNARSTNLSGNIQFLEKLSELTAIDLSDNSFYVDPSIKFMRYSTLLTEIRLSNCNISAIDDQFNFTIFKVLAILDLSMNQIEVIRNSHFRILASQMRYLNLSRNNIKCLEDQSFFWFRKLNDFDLSFNRVINVSKTMIYLFDKSEAIRIVINNNLVSSFDIDLSTALMASSIDLANNQLTEIPSTFAINQFEMLAQLSLSFNYITSITASSFLQCTQLKSLRLSNNQIEVIERRSFSVLKLVTVLDLSNNRINSLNDSTFYGLINLEYLDLSSNQIETINGKIFYPLTCLITLNLNNNTIRLIEDNSFIIFEYLVNIYLSSIDARSLNTTQLTLNGLEYIKRVVVNSEFIQDSADCLNLIQTLREYSYLKFEIYPSPFYNSIYISFLKVKRAYYSEAANCFRVLYFVHFRLQLNLETDTQAKLFIDSCRRLNLANLLKYLNRNQASLAQFEYFDTFLSLVNFD